MAEYTRRSFVGVLGGAILAAPVAIALSGCTSGDDDKKETDEAPVSTGAEESAAQDGAYKLITPGKLTIGSDLAFPPMEYLDGDKPAGFGVAMMEEVCARLGLECNFLSPQNFDTLIAQVAGGVSMDCAVSSITINDEREEEIDFSTPYYDSNLAVVVMDDSGFAGTDDLNGQPIGVQSGSTGEEWVRENLRDSECIPYNTPAEALAGMRAGKVVACIYDEPVAANNVAGEYADCEILTVIATGEQYGIAVSEDNPALLEAINAALAEMEEDGTMDRLYDEWIGGQESEEPAE